MSTDLEFRKSTYSGHGQDCVEVAQISDFDTRGAAIRDSKHPTAGHLLFPVSEWADFLSTALGK